MKIVYLFVFIIISLLFLPYAVNAEVCENCFTGVNNQTFINMNTSQTSTFSSSLTGITNLTVTITDNATLPDMYAVNTSNISAWWKMDETTGISVVDSLGRGNNGTWGNSTVTNITTVTGKFDNGFQFNGTGSYINFGNTSTTDIVNNDMSIEAWINPNSTSGLQAIVGKIQFGTNSWGLYQNTDQFWFQWRGAGGDSSISSAIKYKAHEWNYVVATRTVTTNRLYVNGMLQPTTSTNAQIPATTAFNFTIGERTNNTHDYFFNGSVDNVAIYTRALNSSEIVSRYFQSLEELKVTATGNGTQSNFWINNTNNPLVVPVSNTDTITGLTYTLPSTEVLNKTLISNYTNTTQWNITSSVSYVQNVTVFNETTEGSYYHYNASVLALHTTTSGSINITILNDTFLNAAYKDVPSITGNTSNFTVYLNSPFLNISTGSLNTTNAINFNISILFNSTPPNISFFTPTLDNNSVNSTGTAIVNTSIFSGFGSSAFINWNNSLIGWFKFNEGTGNSALDSSPNSHNAAFVNVSNSLDSCIGNVCNGWNSSGEMGDGLSFNNSAFGYLNIGTDSTAPQYNITGDFTIEAWVRSVNDSSASIGISQGIYGKGYDYNSKKGVALLLKSYTKWNINKIVFLVGNGTKWGEVYSNTSYVVGKWHHIVGTRNGTNLQIYKDGLLDTSTDTITGNVLYYTYGAAIGRPGWDSSYFNGTLDEVRVWNRTLSPNEISASFNASLGYYNTFGNLTNGTLAYQGYIQSKEGWMNSTETRFISVSRTPPNFTSWGNNLTNDNSLLLTSEVFTPVKFNVTTDQTMDLYQWLMGVSTSTNNFNNYTYYFNSRQKNLSVMSQDTNINGTISKQWNINVKQVPEIQVLYQ